MKTEEQFDQAALECRDIYTRKLGDYGISWRLLRPSSLTDQLYIKAKRIRGLEMGGENLVGDSIKSETMALVNYSIMALIQLEIGVSDTTTDISRERATELYDKYIGEARTLMMRKNHDYGEAWRQMRTSSYTDFILTKLARIKEIEDNNGHVEVSEGVEGNYFDIINYAMFGLIKYNEK